MGLIIPTTIVAFISMFVPGVLLALALLKKTDLHLFEIIVIGFIFGLIAPAGLTWVESFLVQYGFHMFAFSLGLFEANALALTVLGIVLCFWQGVFKDMRMPGRGEILKAEEHNISAAQSDYAKTLHEIRGKLSAYEQAKALIAKHVAEEEELKRKHAEEQKLVNRLDSSDRVKLSELHAKEESRLAEDHAKEEEILLKRLSAPLPSSGAAPKFDLRTAWPWMLLLLIMLVTFATRIGGILPSPHFFEFDPYFDMMAAQSILVYGQQFYTSHSAWPIETAGSVMRIQPIVPYLEAYWYSLANYFGTKNNQTFNTNLMSWVGSVYPPIVAALLVFSVFVLLYHEYGKYVGLIGAALAASMPVLFTTFVSGEQLLEPWGLFALFFFLATYTLSIRDKKSTRLAILAGIAFSTAFLGAHYYTVNTGILTIYIIAEGVIGTLRGTVTKYFYKMNIIVIATIAVFMAAYSTYRSTLTSALPTVGGIPIMVAWPAMALALIAIMQYLPIILKKHKIIFKSLDWKEYLLWTAFMMIIVIAAVFFSPLGKTVVSYINLSSHYTTPSIPLFMTVQEYVPTGPLYNFGAAGMGLLGASIGGIPVLVWAISIIAFVLLAMGIIFRKSQTAILYAVTGAGMMLAGMSEIKYLPHFSIMYIILFGIIIGELLMLADSDFSIKAYSKNIPGSLQKRPDYKNAFAKHANFVYSILSIGVFFVSPILAMIMLIALIALRRGEESKTALWAMLVLFIIIEIAALAINHQLMQGESRSITEAFGAMYTYAVNPVGACNIIGNNGNGIGQDMFCNLIPSYWLNAMAWLNTNIGVTKARVLAWWDYGDWINWFGNSFAVLRGDNSAPLEDYATAASYVLGPADGYGPTNLSHMMNSNQTKYVLFDEDLVAKWQALDFLACVDINATSKAFALAQGQAQNPPVPYALGNSPCEIQHDPQFALIPLAALQPTNQSVQSISYYCKISNSTSPLIASYLVDGNSLSNKTVCVSGVPNANGVQQVYNQSGGKLNAVVQLSFYEGVISISGIPFVEYMMIYLPNGANSTITDAPSEFYNSTYYRGFFLGKLPGFTQVYPANSPGINFVNGTYPVRIYELNNFTGQLPPRTPKPPWVANNFTMPG